MCTLSHPKLLPFCSVIGIIQAAVGIICKIHFDFVKLNSPHSSYLPWSLLMLQVDGKCELNLEEMVIYCVCSCLSKQFSVWQLLSLSRRGNEILKTHHIFFQICPFLSLNSLNIMDFFFPSTLRGFLNSRYQFYILCLWWNGLLPCQPSSSTVQ